MWKDVSVPEAYPSHFRLLLSTLVIQDVALRNLSPQRRVYRIVFIVHTVRFMQDLYYYMDIRCNIICPSC